MLIADDWVSPEADLAAGRRQRRMIHTTIFLMLLIMFALNSKQSTTEHNVDAGRDDVESSGGEEAHIPFYKELSNTDIKSFMDVLHRGVENQTDGDGVDPKKDGKKSDTYVKTQPSVTVKSRSWDAWNNTGLYNGQYKDISESISWKPQTLIPTGLKETEHSTEPYIKWDSMGQAIFEIKEQQFIEGTKEEVSVFWGRLLLASGFLQSRPTVHGGTSERKDVTVLVQGVIFHRFNRISAIAGLSATEVEIVWNENAGSTEANSRDAASSPKAVDKEESVENTASAEDEQDGDVSPPSSPTLGPMPVAVWPASAEKPESYSSIRLGPIGGHTAMHWRELHDTWRHFERSNNGKNCEFLLNLQDRIVSKSSARHTLAWTQILEGEFYCINCKFKSRIKVTKLRVDVISLYPKAVHYSIFVTMICIFQIYCIVKQLNHSQAQAVAVRVSVLCISLQAVLDAFLCIFHLLALFWQSLFVTFSSVAFLKLVIFCIFEMRYMMVVTQAHFPESFLDGGVLVRRQMAAMHARIYAALIVILVLLWYVPTLVPLLLMGLYSFWIPQITWNAIQDTRGALHPSYMWGMSTTRLFIPAYFYGCSNSIMRSVGLLTTSLEIDRWRTIVLVLWMGAQVMVMTLQEKYGPRFFIPKQFLPKKYDYHRPIPSSLIGTATTSLGDEEMQLISRKEMRGSVTETSEGSSAVTCVDGDGVDVEAGGIGLECSICFIEVEPTHGNYMITPCHHVYHSQCLVRWMEIKLECPSCR